MRVNALWSRKEDELIRKHHPNFRIIERLLPHRTWYAIHSRSSSLGLGSVKSWEPAEDDLIRKLTPMHSDEEMAKMLGRTVAAVGKRRKGMGIRRHRQVKGGVVPVVVDVMAEAARRHVRVNTLTKALRCPRIRSATEDTHLSLAAIALVTEAFGGELYAEWDD